MSAHARALSHLCSHAAWTGRSVLEQRCHKSRDTPLTRRCGPSTARYARHSPLDEFMSVHARAPSRPCSHAAWAGRSVLEQRCHKSRDTPLTRRCGPAAPWRRRHRLYNHFVHTLAASVGRERVYSALQRPRREQQARAGRSPQAPHGPGDGGFALSDPTEGRQGGRSGGAGPAAGCWLYFYSK